MENSLSQIAGNRFFGKAFYEGIPRTADLFGCHCLQIEHEADNTGQNG